MVTLRSFGFRYGKPSTGRIIDSRGVSNPYRRANLRRYDGRDAEVQRVVMRSAQAKQVAQRCIDRVLAGETEISIGCGWGRHRSVAIVEHVAAALQTQGISVRVSHRELGGVL